MMLSFSASRKNTESQKILFNEVCKALERRWVEIKGKFRKSLPEAQFLVFIPKSLLLFGFKGGATFKPQHFRSFSSCGAGTFRQFLGAPEQSQL